MTYKYSDYDMYIRRHILSTLLRNFDDNRAIYECADEWVEKFVAPHTGIIELYKASHDVIDYYKTHFDK
tara:strand:+ start:883 stop:1089 length:207 start_codon:yes stop_codon:yes gene_type:complete